MTPDPSPTPASAPPPPGAQAGARTRRDRTTRRSVVVGERVARTLITLGGLGTILAVATIFLFLGSVVWPLLKGASTEAAGTVEAPAAGTAPLAVGSDEYGLLAWSVLADGTLEVVARVRGADAGAPAVRRVPLSPGAPPTALAVGYDPASSALGYADGTVRPLRIAFRGELLPDTGLPAALRGMREGEVRLFEDGAAESLPSGDVRLQRLEVRLGDPLPVAQAAVARLDRAEVAGGYVIACVDATGRATVDRIEERVNPFDRAKRPKVTRTSAVLDYDGASAGSLPDHVAVTGAGDNVLLLWADGRALRFDARDYDRPQLAEALDLVPAPGARMTAVSWLLGRTTLVVGDSEGQVRSWFRKKPADSASVGTSDRALLVAAHDLGRHTSPVTALAPSPRGRTLAVGHADGRVVLVHGTSHRRLAELDVASGGPVAAVAFAPKEDALLARTDRVLDRWTLDPGHPETSWDALFGRVWYEGFEKPEHVWQSTGGTDDFEPKLGLVPLVFGTLKATVFSMLFAVPIALLAAVFTSEFLSARLRVAVKSVIEMMASLPSVVLGFLAAIVIAPFVQDIVPAVLAAFVLVPALLLLGAHLWQLLPSDVALRLAGWPRLALLVAVFPLSLLLASLLGPVLEDTLFRGDLKRWLNHEISAADAAAVGAPVPDGADADGREAHLAALGAEASGKPAAGDAPTRLRDEQREALVERHRRGAVGGWLYLLLPVAAVTVVLLMGRVVNPWIRSRSARWSRAVCGWVALGKLVAGGLVTLLLALLLAHLVTLLGGDPRGDFSFAARGEGALMGRYDKSNALVLGFVMGFAIIPIIYTLAEDALSSVPQHLRLGSLGAGATPWQTAVRIIIPTAMSGLFSAVMIGLGRAVGETMIVLMAAGNTSILEWNMFNGMRTLSANIATEMPEAVVGSTHYRVLFLAALTLFALTFTLNTLAERVRARFRRRAFQL